MTLAFAAEGCAQTLTAEFSATASDGEFAPMWLTSNSYGVVSPYANSSYERVALKNEINRDTLSGLQLGYGLDVVLSQNSVSTFMIHQAFAELGYKKVVLTLGQKERPVDFRNNRLTSGGLSQGINATPIPEALLEVKHFTVPYTNHWLKAGGRLGFGRSTDGKWQEEFVGGPDTEKRYTSNYLYHEKVVQFRIGKEEVLPLTFDVELQMMTQFGGTSYNALGRNHYDKKIPIVHPENLSAFWHAFWPMGSSDVTDGVNLNAAGNTFGSYNMALTWRQDDWYARAYFERMFEDHSMLTVQYGIYDHLLGLEVKLPANPYVSHVLIEHINSKDQAGPVYHDSTANMPESYCGMDNYYNHGHYSGWQHWGMGMGNPLFLSPIYNESKTLEFKNNRIRALHVGVDGNPSDQLSWRILASVTRSWGTYGQPYDDVMWQRHLMAEVSYAPKRMRGWNAAAAVGYDHGFPFGNSLGCQFTVRKEIKL